MKKLLILLVALLAFAGTAEAQYIINNIGYTPYQQPTITSEQVDYNLNNGCRFRGTCWYHNGQVNRYQGDMYFPDGRVLNGSFTPNFGYKSDSTYQLKNPDNTMYIVTYDNNGNELTRRVYNQPMTIDPGRVVPGVNPNSGYDNPVSDHWVRCTGCNGTGTCRSCQGRGLNNRGYHCGSCHGTGRCQNCAGVGKVMI